MKYYIIIYSGSTPGESGEKCKTEYEFDYACEACGTGAELMGRLKVKGISKTKRVLFKTINGDFIISKSLYNRIIEQIPSFRLEQVIDTKNQSLEFYHFYTKSNLPKFKENSSGFVREAPCTNCNRNGYYNDVILGTPTIVKPLDFRYNKNELEHIPGAVILKTWECSGLSHKTNFGKYVIRYARPWIVVREDLKNIFDKEKIKNLHYEQIKIEGCLQN